MALKPAGNCLLVQPSLVDNNESQRQNGLYVVGEQHQGRKLYRGVVQCVGANVTDDIQIGNVALYSDFVIVEELHVVPEQNLIAWDDDS